MSWWFLKIFFKKQNQPPQPKRRKVSKPYYSKEHIDKNLKELLEYLQDEGSLESKHRANIIKQIFEDNVKAKKVNNYLESKVNKEELISSEEATALLVDYNWIQRDYQGLKNLTDKKKILFTTI